MTEHSESTELQRFESLLDLHGARLERWPEAEEQRARALLQRVPAARELLERAVSFEAMLDVLDAPEPSAALRRAVAEIPLHHPRTAGARALGVPAWFPFRSWAMAVGVATLALGLGVVAGSLMPVQTEVVTASAAHPEQELSELAALAFADALDEELAP